MAKKNYPQDYQKPIQRQLRRRLDLQQVMPAKFSAGITWHFLDFGQKGVFNHRRIEMGPIFRNILEVGPNQEPA